VKVGRGFREDDRNKEDRYIQLRGGCSHEDPGEGASRVSSDEQVV